MRKILVVLVMLFFSVSVHAEEKEYTLENTFEKDTVRYNKETNQPITGVLKEYYDTGELQYETPFKDGLMNGILRSYYKSGQLEDEISYKNGIVNGFEKAYREDGSPLFEMFFENGKSNGLHRIYRESGVIWFEIPYKGGQENGVVKTYYKSGNLAQEIQYKNGLKDGLEIDYTESGEIKNKAMYRNDRLVSIGDETTQISVLPMIYTYEILVKIWPIMAFGFIPPEESPCSNFSILQVMFPNLIGEATPHSGND